MIDERELLEQALRAFEPQPGLTDRVYRRRERKRRNQRMGAVTLAIILALVSFAALTRAFRTAERPADEPTRPQGIFSEVGGWIAYGTTEGIWAMNPTPGGLPTDRTQLSDSPGEPLAWSSDGSKLLFSREVADATRNPILDLFVLNADGTETRLTKDRDRITGSISPDGSQVVYVAGFDGHMYTVDTEGGEPRLLHASAGLLDSPTFSPDGTQIAYFVGGGDWGNTLRVMNADGSDVRVVIDQEFGHVNDLAWSPDGSRLAFHGPYGGGIWTVGVDGSGLTKVSQLGAAPRWSPTGRQLAFESAGGIWVINADGSGLRQVTLPGRRAPVWSPDGSRIAYLEEDSLYVADLDGTHVRSLGTLELTPSPKPPLVWIPPLQSASGEEQRTATVGGSGGAPFVYAIAVLGAVGVLVIAWRARRRIAAR
jgi:Tol biopolymer transport system component